jgi:hypothetical protein
VVFKYVLVHVPRVHDVHVCMCQVVHVKLHVTYILHITYYSIFFFLNIIIILKNILYVTYIISRSVYYIFITVATTDCMLCCCINIILYQYL